MQNFTKFHFLTVDGEWSEWGAYGECSAPCGGGYKIKHRYCNNPAPAYGGADCYGNDSYNVTCNTHHCAGWYKICLYHQLYNGFKLVKVFRKFVSFLIKENSTIKDVVDIEVNINSPRDMPWLPLLLLLTSKRNILLKHCFRNNFGFNIISLIAL